MGYLLYNRRKSQRLLEFINDFDLIGFKTIELSELEIPNSEDSHRFEVVDLKYLDDISDILSKSEQLKYNFLDIGCGTGISTIYASVKLNFSHYLGFDFAKKLIDVANENIQNNKINQKKIDFIYENALFYQVEDTSRFCHLFHPFNYEILKTFIDNNVTVFRDNSCIIYYVNCIHISIFYDYDHVTISKNKVENYENAVIKFYSGPQK